MAEKRWFNNALVMFFFTRHYSEDGACRFLWFLLPERALSKERSLLQRVPLAVNVTAIYWKIQTSLLTSLFCCLPWDWVPRGSAQLWAQLGSEPCNTALALETPLAPVALWEVCEREGIPPQTQWEWIVRSALFSNLLSPYSAHSMSSGPWARCWDIKGEWKYITRN